MRTINLHYTADDLYKFQAALDAKGCEHPSKEMERVIGYLASWGPTYPVVDIYMALGELQACYRNKPYENFDKPSFFIGAVFNDDNKKFGFYS